MCKRLLIVDDKEKLCKILAEDFSLSGIEANYALNSHDAKSILKSFTPDVILLDLKLGNERGLDLLRDLKKDYKEIPVIMVTGYGSIESAVEAIKIGAWDYIQKPVNFTKILQSVNNAAKNRELESVNLKLKSRFQEGAREKIITQDPKMTALLDKLLRLSQRDFPILITGESGTGKELIAEYIHYNSQRAENRLHKINCAAIAPNLLDNELFGHEKGSYTGANELYKGIFERANGGTLFLDELGDMPLETQAKILRTLQNSEIRRVGGSKTIKVDIRFIAATNKNIKEMVINREFREDLYYRLNLAEVSLPPLRDRSGDIAYLINHFLNELSENWGVDKIKASSEILKVLMDYDWPGNIRELKNIINYMAAVSNNGVLSVKDLPGRLIPENCTTEEVNPIEDLEERVIRESLEFHRFNKKLTAEKLKISRKTLYNKMKKYGIKV